MNTPLWSRDAAIAMEQKLLDSDALRLVYQGGAWESEHRIAVNHFAIAIDRAVGAAAMGGDPLLALRDALLDICRDNTRLLNLVYEHAMTSVKPILKTGDTG